jgi:Haemolysin secretion/activation protein ShlB/FhaC/HecB
VARGDTYRLNWRDQLQARGGIDHGFTWGLTFRDERDRNSDVAGINTATGGLRYTTIDLGYDLSFAGPAGESGGVSAGVRTTNLTAKLVVSPSGFNRREVDCNGRMIDQFACKRSEATPGFQVLKLNISHREPVFGWPVTLRLQGQLSDQPLASAEQVQYGGVDTVRGYLEAERVGDLGAAATLELSTPTWAALQGLNLRALAFYDHAVLRRLKPLPQEATEQRLASTGLGLRLETRFGLTASLDWARWLIDTHKLDRLATPASPASSGLRVRDKSRWDLALRQSF